MFTSKSGLLLAILMITGLLACTPRPVNSTPTISPSPLPTASRARPTLPSPTWTPTATRVVPSVPNDERIIASIDVGKAPWNMAVGNGYLWIIADDSVVRIDLQTNQVTGNPIRVSVTGGASLEAISVNDDALWVSIVGWGDISAPNDIDSVLRIDPQTSQSVARIKVRRGPVSLAITPESIWAVNWGAHVVSRIDLKDNQLAGEPFKMGHGPYSMTVGDGSLWVANHDSGTLTRIDPETNKIIADVSLPEEPHRVAFGEDAIWVGNWHDQSVSRIDPQTNQVVGEPIPIGYVAGNIAAGYGNVWVTSDYRGTQAFPEAFSDHTVLIRIDPKTNTVVDTIPLGGHPVDVKVTKDAVWVSIQYPDRVLKIQP